MGNILKVLILWWHKCGYPAKEVVGRLVDLGSEDSIIQGRALDEVSEVGD